MSVYLVQCRFYARQSKFFCGQLKLDHGIPAVSSNAQISPSGAIRRTYAPQICRRLYTRSARNLKARDVAVTRISSKTGLRDALATARVSANPELIPRNDARHSQMARLENGTLVILRQHAPTEIDLVATMSSIERLYDSLQGDAMFENLIRHHTDRRPTVSIIQLFPYA